MAKKKLGFHGFPTAIGGSGTVYPMFVCVCVTSE